MYALITSVLVLMAPIPPEPPPAVKPLTGSMPSLHYLRGEGENLQSVRYDAKREVVLVTVTKTAMQNGKPILVTVQEAKERTTLVPVTTKFSLHDARVHLASGASIDRKTVKTRLSRGEICIVVPSGQKLDPQYLTCFKGDTLVIQDAVIIPVPVPAQTPHIPRVAPKP